MKNFVMLAIAMCVNVQVFADTSSIRGSFGGSSDPAIVDVDNNFIYKFRSLPLSGNIGTVGLGWPSYFWASEEAIIANRWQMGGDNWEYSSPSSAAISSMSESAISRLSPAEKYDIFLGRFDYPTKKLAREHGSPRARDWNGICHGMAPASVHHTEPSPVTVTGRNGQRIHFTTSDVKGLLGFYYAFYSDSETRQVGSRCFFRPNAPFVRRSAACQGLNPASFHIVLANLLGKQGKSFVTEISQYKEVWNHSVYDYNSRVLLETTRGSRRNRVRSVKVQTDVRYAGSIEPHHNPILMTPEAKFEEKRYTYWLNLNASGDIVGGEWISAKTKDEDGDWVGGLKPDFLWTKTKGSFNELNGHFKPVIEELFHTAY